MTRDQLNKLMMYRAVIGLFDHNTDAWSHATKLQAPLTELKAVANQLSNSGLTQEQRNSLGLTAEKDEKILLAGSKAFKIKSCLLAYALEIEDVSLAKELDYAKTDFTQGREETLLNRMQYVHQLGTEHQEAAADFLVTEAGLQELQTLISDIRALTANRDAETDQSEATTANIPALLDKADKKILPRIDSLVAGMIEDAQLSAAYKQARKIYDRRSGHSSGDGEKGE